MSVQNNGGNPSSVPRFAILAIFSNLFGIGQKIEPTLTMFLILGKFSFMLPKCQKFNKYSRFRSH